MIFVTKDKKCRKCGNPSDELWNGIGACCSPEIQEHRKWLAAYEKRKAELFYALRTRLLTPEESQEVMELDYYILVREGVCFNEESLRRIFNEALLQQFKMREIHEAQLRKAEQ